MVALRSECKCKTLNQRKVLYIYKTFVHGLSQEKENGQLFCRFHAIVDKNLSGTELRSKLACLTLAQAV